MYQLGLVSAITSPKGVGYGQKNWVGGFVYVKTNEYLGICLRSPSCQTILKLQPFSKAWVHFQQEATQALLNSPKAAV